MFCYDQASCQCFPYVQCIQYKEPFKVVLEELALPAGERWWWYTPSQITSFILTVLLIVPSTLLELGVSLFVHSTSCACPRRIKIKRILYNIDKCCWSLRCSHLWIWIQHQHLALSCSRIIAYIYMIIFSRLATIDVCVLYFTSHYRRQLVSRFQSILSQ